MLKDMPKSSHVHLPNKGFSRNAQKWEKNWEDAPSHESIRPRNGWMEGGGISWAPLRRYLNKSIGKTWKEVCQKIPQEYSEVLHWMISTDVQKVGNNLYFSPQKWWGGFFFVENGILRKVADKPRYRRPKQVMPEPIFVETHGYWAGGKVNSRWIWHFSRKIVGYTTIYNNERYMLREGIWYKTVQTGWHDKQLWNSETYKYVTIGREPIYKELQISKKVKKQLEEYITSWNRKNSAS